MLKKLLSGILILVVSPLVISCSLNKDNSSIEDILQPANEALGIEIPWPHYLPEGYTMKNVMVSDNTSATLFISNDDKNSITLEIVWKQTGVIPYKIDVNRPTLEINGLLGQLLEDEKGENGVIWNWYPERYEPGLIVLKLFVPAEITVNDLKMIAESISWD